MRRALRSERQGRKNRARAVGRRASLTICSDLGARLRPCVSHVECRVRRLEGCTCRCSRWRSGVKQRSGFFGPTARKIPFSSPFRHPPCAPDSLVHSSFQYGLHYRYLAYALARKYRSFSASQGIPLDSLSPCCAEVDAGSFGGVPRVKMKEIS
jgi:hypothetical protein